MANKLEHVSWSVAKTGVNTVIGLIQFYIFSDWGVEEHLSFLLAPLRFRLRFLMNTPDLTYLTVTGKFRKRTMAGANLPPFIWRRGTKCESGNHCTETCASLAKRKYINVC